MAIFDVRNNEVGAIDEIRFADEDDYTWSILTHISSEEIRDGNILLIPSGEYARIHSKIHARNLIKALEKAIELGWLKD